MAKWWRIVQVLWEIFKVIKTARGQAKIESVLPAVTKVVKKDTRKWPDL